MTVYFTLVRKDAAVGDTLDDTADQWVTADPRHIPVIEITDDYLGLPELTDAWTLARVHPQDEPEQDGLFYDASGWVIDGFDPVTGLLGPQAEQIIAADRIWRDKLNSAHAEPGSPEGIYTAVLNASWDDPRRAAAENAAAKALRAAGIDAEFVNEIGSCVAGTAITALAARDLIGATPGWTQDAYDFLTAPWVAALGPIHPGDQP